MKILLVRPHSDVPAAAPPLGLLYLASYLRTFGSHEIEILDARLKEYDFDTIGAKIRQSNADLVGITAFSLEFRETREIAAQSKKALPNARVLVGGPYATSDYKKVLSDPNVDIAVMGEAERTFQQLVQALESGDDWTQINEIAFRQNGDVVKTAVAEFISNLDELPYPAWDLVNLDEYFYRKGTAKRTCFNQHQWKKRILSIFTTRGCPYQCTYCHNLFGKKIRQRSVENVIGELRLMKDKFNVEEVEIVDDIFNLDMDRAKQIFRRVIEEKLDMKFSFPNAIRSDRVDEEMLDLFKAGGVYRIVFAIESGSPRIQKMIRKNLDLNIARRNIDLAAKRGFSLGGFFMMGFLDETEEELMSTIKFAIDAPIHTATLPILTPFPGTEIYNDLIARGYDLPTEYEHYQKVHVNISKIPTERLEKLRQMTFRKFYLSPRRLWGILRTTPWKDRFFTKLWILFLIAFFKYEK
ncbi:MAG: radical SAM protein [bacterium]|nr:radical SAM protein [bacterium]